MCFSREKLHSRETYQSFAQDCKLFGWCRSLLHIHKHMVARSAAVPDPRSGNDLSQSLCSLTLVEACSVCCRDKCNRCDTPKPPGAGGGGFGGGGRGGGRPQAAPQGPAGKSHLHLCLSMLTSKLFAKASSLKLLLWSSSHCVLLLLVITAYWYV